MIRTQISLSVEQHRFLTELARQRRESLASIIRKAVEDLRLREMPPRRRALELLGAFQADRDDVSIKHDDYFAGNGEPEP